MQLVPTLLVLHELVEAVMMEQISGQIILGVLHHSFAIMAMMEEAK
jgi:hypothetical protein